jgi:hypothetical protein
VQPGSQGRWDCWPVGHGYLAVPSSRRCRHPQARGAVPGPLLPARRGTCQWTKPPLAAVSSRVHTTDARPGSRFRILPRPISLFSTKPSSTTKTMYRKRLCRYPAFAHKCPPRQRD